MQVKKFEGSSMQDAIDQVKRELGPEAIILQTKRIKKGFGANAQNAVEITAAIADRAVSAKQRYEALIPEERKQEVRNLPVEKQREVLAGFSGRPREQSPQRAQSPRVPEMMIDHELVEAQSAARSAEVQSLRNELNTLRRELAELQNNPDRVLASALEQSPWNHPLLTEALEALRAQGVEAQYCSSLVKQAVFSLGMERFKNSSVDSGLGEALQEQLAVEMIDTIGTQSILSEAPAGQSPQMLCLLGPTGVGKTTVALKLLVREHRRGKKVLFVDLGAGSSKSLVQALGLEYRHPQSERRTLVSMKQDFDAFDLVILDTAGHSPRDVRTVLAMRSELEAVPQIRRFFVFSVTHREAEQMDWARALRDYRAESLIITKLDEAVTYGCLYNFNQRLKLPLSQFGIGSRVPDDLEDASAERVAALILDLT